MEGGREDHSFPHRCAPVPFLIDVRQPECMCPIITEYLVAVSSRIQNLYIFLFRIYTESCTNSVL